MVSRRLVVYSTVDIHGICYICGCHSRSQVEFLNPQMRKSPGFLSDLVSRLPDSVNLTSSQTLSLLLHMNQLTDTFISLLITLRTRQYIRTEKAVVSAQSEIVSS